MLGAFTALQVRILGAAAGREQGAGVVEYLLLVLFLALALITAIGLFSDSLREAFSKAGSSIPS